MLATLVTVYVLGVSISAVAVGVAAGVVKRGASSMSELVDAFIDHGAVILCALVLWPVLVSALAVYGVLAVCDVGGEEPPPGPRPDYAV